MRFGNYFFKQQSQTDQTDPPLSPPSHLHPNLVNATLPTPNIVIPDLEIIDLVPHTYVLDQIVFEEMPESNDLENIFHGIVSLENSDFNM